MKKPLRATRPSILAVGLAALAAGALALACEAPPGELDAEVRGRGGSTAEEASGAATAPGSARTSNGLPCAVSDFLAKNCQACHGAATTSGASASLVTWDDLQKDRGGKKVYELVGQRIHAETGRMPPAKRIPDAELKVIDDWIGAGAARSAESCEAEGPGSATKPFVCGDGGKTTVLKAPTPFKWTKTAKQDRYVCFGVDEQVASKRHVIGMGPMIQNLDIVHHVLLFQSKTAVSNTPTECSSSASASWKLVTGWAPGGGNFELPPEAGYPEEEGTTHWVLQVHYNNAKDLPDQVDNSGYQLCSTDKLRPNDAGVLAFGATSFSIPPRTPSYTLRCDYKLPGSYEGVKFFAASPHMHTRGLAIATERLAGGRGTPQTIFEQKPFSFENQENFEIGTKEVAPGDVMRTRCTWKNPGDTAVGFGENTDDEMCFNFLMYYPAIPDVVLGPIPVQTWLTPSLALPSPLTGGVKCAKE